MVRTITRRAGSSLLSAATSDQPSAVPVSKRSAKIRFDASCPRARVAERAGRVSVSTPAAGTAAAGRPQRRRRGEAIEREVPGERGRYGDFDLARRIVLVEQQQEELVGVAADRESADVGRIRRDRAHTVAQGLGAGAVVVQEETERLLGLRARRRHDPSGREIDPLAAEDRQNLRLGERARRRGVVAPGVLRQGEAGPRAVGVDPAAQPRNQGDLVGDPGGRRVRRIPELARRLQAERRVSLAAERLAALRIVVDVQVVDRPDARGRRGGRSSAPDTRRRRAGRRAPGGPGRRCRRRRRRRPPPRSRGRTSPRCRVPESAPPNPAPSPPRRWRGPAPRPRRRSAPAGGRRDGSSSRASARCRARSSARRRPTTGRRGWPRSSTTG